MSSSRIPSPARSQGSLVTPRRSKTKRTRSVGSPARSTASGRLSALVQFKENNQSSFVLSPAPSRRSVLNDDTHIEEPRRKSWWKNLGDNSRDVMEVLTDNKMMENNEAVEEYIDIEVLSQEKKNYTIDLPDSSDSESISSIVIPQRKLFTQKDLQAQNKFGQLIGTRESLVKLHKTNVADKTVNVAPKNLFGQNNKVRVKPVFPAALLNISPNKTANKTKEIAAPEAKVQVKSFFGNRAGTKRKNMFADFIVSESEDEISDIQPKVFGFQKKVDQRRDSSASRGKRDHSPTSSITTDIEMDEWRLLPSSTMVENQLEDMLAARTPVKRARLSQLAETKESQPETIAEHDKESEEDLEELKYDDENQQQNKCNSDKDIEIGKIDTSKQGPAGIEMECGTEELAQDANTNKTQTQNVSKVIEENLNKSQVLSVNHVSQNQMKNLEKDEVDNEVIGQTNLHNTSKNKTQTLNRSRTRNTSQKELEIRQDKETDAVSENNMDTETEVPSENKVVNQDKKHKDSEIKLAMTQSEQPDTVPAESEKEIILSVNENTGFNSGVVVQEDQKVDKNKSAVNAKEASHSKIQVDEHTPNKTKEPKIQIDETNMKDLPIEEEGKQVETNEEQEDNEIENDEEERGESVAIEEQLVESDEEEEEHETTELDYEQSEEEAEENQQEEEQNDTEVESEVEEQIDDTEEKPNEEQDLENINEDQAESEAKLLNKSNIEIHKAKPEIETANAEANKIRLEQDDMEAENQDENAADVQMDEDDEVVQDDSNIEDQGGESEGEAQIESGDEAENVSEVEAHKESEVEAHKESEVEAHKESEVEAHKESEVEAHKESEVEAHKESEVEAHKESEVEAHKESEVEAHKESEVEAQNESENEELNETENEELNETENEELNETEIDAQYESEDEALNESEVDAQNESDVPDQNESENEEQSEVEAQNETAVDQNESENEEQNESEVEAQNESDNEAQNASADEAQNESDEEEQNESEELQYDNESEEGIQNDSHGDEIQDSNDIDEIQHSNNADTPNESHDTTGRHRKKHESKLNSPEAILHDKTNQITSFTAQGRNTSIRKTTMLKNMTIRQSLAPLRESTGLSDGTTNSSAEGSGWDSHRTTRKTLRQTFGKDFTPRKSLRALVMEKSAKRQTAVTDLTTVTSKFPQANSTEFPEASIAAEDDENLSEAVHDVSKRTRQTTLEMYLQKIKKQNLERKMKMEEAVKNSLKMPARPHDPFKLPAKPLFSLRKNKATQKQSKSKVKSTLIPLDLPPEVIEDMKYKPPKRFQPSNASWITKRLYKFLESKLESKYDYKARVRAEKLVESIYQFSKDLRRLDVAPGHSVDALKQEMARLDVVRTHFDFYQFFHDYMPREVRVKVVPDVVNKIGMPRHGVFSDILRGNNVQG